MAAFLITSPVLTATTAQAQFRSDIDLVTLDVCVRDATGGFVAALTAADFLVFENGVAQRVYAQIDEEVRHRYRLGYVSTDARANAEWRELSVRVTTPNAHARTRSGYYASTPAFRTP